MCDDAAMSGVTTIDTGLRVKGEISGPGDVRIRGHFEGLIQVTGSVWVEEGGVAMAQVIAGRVRVDGVLDGRVRASRQVSIGPRGKLIGDVWGMLAVDEGGVFQGRIVPESDDRISAPRAAPPPSPLKLRVDPDNTNPLRLATKRRVTQPSADAVQGPGSSGSMQSASDRFHAVGEWVATGEASRPGARAPVRPDSAGVKTPRRLVAMPREPIVPQPLLDEAPPPAPSSRQLPAVSREDIARRAAPKMTPPPEPVAPPLLAHVPATRSQRSVPPTPPRSSPPTAPPNETTVEAPAPVDRGTPKSSRPGEQSLVESWFEEDDFLVKRAEASGEFPVAEKTAPKPQRRSPSKKSSGSRPRRKK
jgi:cytoskeletal protein CcmA (bactofilin family)